jgi:dihydroneopterin aldolase
MSDCVFVRGLEFEGNHGYTAAERRGTRRFRVNVTLEQPLGPAAASDKLVDTIDYWKVSDLVVSIGTKSTFKLLEALGGAIAARLQELYPRAGVIIEVEKLAPPCPGVPASCGVRLQFCPRDAAVPRSQGSTDSSANQR